MRKFTLTTLFTLCVFGCTSNATPDVPSPDVRLPDVGPPFVRQRLLSICHVDAQYAAIMRGQVDVVDCMLNNDRDGNAVYLQCVIDAWNAHRPFFGVGQSFVKNGRLVEYRIYGRRTARGFQCIDARSETYGWDGKMEILSTSYGPNPPTLGREEVFEVTLGDNIPHEYVAHEAMCPPDLMPEPAISPADYNPPEVIPTGIVCVATDTDAEVTDTGPAAFDATLSDGDPELDAQQNSDRPNPARDGGEGDAVSFDVPLRK